MAAWQRRHWLVLDGDERRAAVQNGVPPGVPLADLLFSFGMQRALQRTRTRIAEAGLVTELPQHVGGIFLAPEVRDGKG